MGGKKTFTEDNKKEGIKDQGSGTWIASFHSLLSNANSLALKCDSSNETKIKEKQNETVPDLNSNLAKSMTHDNQTKELTIWFLNLPLDESIDNKSIKFEVQI
jgi:hypothetical protein